MAVVDVELDWSSLERAITRKGRTGKARYTVSFDGTDTPHEMSILATATSDVPSVGDSYPGDAWLICDSAIPKPTKGLNLWTVDCRYVRGGWSVPEQEENPLKQKPIIRYYSVITTEQIDKDINGSPIQNSAGEPFDPPITAEIYTHAIEIVRNERSFSQQKAETYRNSLNGTVFWGASPGKCWMSRMDGEEIVSGDYEYVKMTYEIQFRKDGWARRIVDQGYRVKGVMPSTTSSSGQTATVNLTDKDGLPLAEPHLLDGAGNKLVLAEGVEAYWHEFEILEKVNWRPLDLPL